VFLIYGSKITAASRGFPATARLSCSLTQKQSSYDDCNFSPTCYFMISIESTVCYTWTFPSMTLCTIRYDRRV